MKKLVLSLLLVAPLLANANTSQLGQVSNTLSGSHVANTNLQTSDSSAVDLGTIDFLKDFPGKFSNPQNQHTDKADINTSNEVPVPAAIPLLITAIALFGFGANRRRV